MSELEGLPLWHDDVCGWRQLVDGGVTPAKIKASIAAERWQRPLPRVVISKTGTPSRRQQFRAALKFADGREDGRAYVAYWSAAEVHNFGLPIRPEVHVAALDAGVVSYGGKVVVHETRCVREGDVVEIDGIRVASIGRSLLDLAPKLYDRELRYLVARLVQRNNVSKAYLLETVAGARRWPGIVRLRRHVAAVAAGARSGSEIRLLEGLASRGWYGQPNLLVAIPGRGDREGDVVFEAIRTVVQVESVEHHGLDPDVESDATRDLDWARASHQSLPAWTTRIENDLEGLLDDLVDALEKRAAELGVPLDVARGTPPDHV